MNRNLVLVFFLFIALASPQNKLHVAVAQTGMKVAATYASTGQLYAQILNGTPYDLFFSADREKPDLLWQEGRAETPFVYATGQVILWTNRKDLCQIKYWREVMVAPGLKNFAVANPKTAPYGAAAMEAMKKTGISAHVQEKLVYAQNIAQAFQYAATDSVDGGFCTLSAALSAEGKKGCFFSVPEAPPIVQGACILKRTTHSEAAGKLAGFLASPEAKTIKNKYGYR